MAADPYALRPRGVYQYMDTLTGLVRYVGSTTCAIHTLDNNHRNWNTLGYSWTSFREALTKYPEYAQRLRVSWLEPPELRTQEQVETIEGICIRTYKSCHQTNGGFNKDMNPVASSLRMKRYELAPIHPKLPFA